MKDLIIIAAIGKNNELGLNNNLIWHLPGDLKFFRKNTMNKNIVMGVNTFKSLPGLLKNRHHIVVTRHMIQNSDITVVGDIKELLNYFKTIDDDVYVIGGATIYKELIPYSNKMLLTEIEDTHEADVFFPKIKEEEWNKQLLKEGEDNGIKYKHYVYRRNDK